MTLQSIGERMKKHKVLVLGVLAVIAAGAYAQSAQKKASTPAVASTENAVEAEVKKLIEPRLGENAKADSVRQTPYSGLFEVRTGGDIIYTDRKGEFIFVGNVLNSKTYENYTRARIDEISKIKFSDLPLESSIKVVKGDGKRVMAIFEDPNCVKISCLFLPPQTRVSAARSATPKKLFMGPPQPSVISLSMIRPSGDISIYC